MDFLRIVRSLEELLYEVMTWLVFYPRTMWRIVARPLETTRYSENEQKDVPDEQYTDTLSPPLFLMLTVLIAHGFELAMGVRMVQARTAAAQALFASEQNLLILRSILFSLFPLMGATAVIRKRRLLLDRSTLRAPFFSQCYLVAPFALVISIAGVLARVPAMEAQFSAAVVSIVGVGWYLSVDTLWFRRQLDVGTGRALLIALGSALKASLYTLLIASLLVLIL